MDKKSPARRCKSASNPFVDLSGERGEGLPALDPSINPNLIARWDFVNPDFGESRKVESVCGPSGTRHLFYVMFPTASGTKSRIAAAGQINDDISLDLLQWNADECDCSDRQCNPCPPRRP